VSDHDRVASAGFEEQEKALSELRRRLERARQMRYKAQARLEELERSKSEILQEIESMGVAPERIDEEIKKLRDEARRLLEEADRLIPAGLAGEDEEEER